MYTHYRNNRIIVDQIGYNLRNNWSNLIRDDKGNLMYGEEWEYCSRNILAAKVFDSRAYEDYYDYYNAVNKVNEEPGFGMAPEDLALFKRYSLKDSPDHEQYQYVGTALKREYWTRWEANGRVFIAAGTGKGKNTFIKRQLLKNIPYGQTVVIFENRDSLLRQQVIDMIKEINPEALKYNDISQSEESMFVFGRKGVIPNIMLISYQTAAIKCIANDQNFFNFCMNARYLVYDEIHYILDDSMINKGICEFANHFLQLNPNFHATKIFMSGTMEEAFQIIQEYDQFDKSFYYREYVDILEDERILENNPEQHRENENRVYVLSLPTDYSYIDPYSYTSYDDIVEAVLDSAPDEKWLIFVDSIRNGYALREKLVSLDLSNQVIFLDAANHKDGKEKEVYDKLINDSMFEQRILIATTVIYNGINIKDNKMTHIVLPFTTIPITKQLIGRKRIDMENNERLKVYFPNVDNQTIMRRYKNCIAKEYNEIYSVDPTNLAMTAEMQLNGLSKEPPSKYYYVKKYPNDKFGIYPDIPVQRKLYFDTLYYIFLLHRITSDDAEENVSRYASIMLRQLRVNLNNISIKDITVESKETARERIRSELITYLESKVGIDIESDENSHEEFLKLKEIINEAYRVNHDEKNLDAHWKNHERFYSKDKLKKFLEEISVPYTIEYSSAKGKGITKITKL